MQALAIVNENAYSEALLKQNKFRGDEENMYLGIAATLFGVFFLNVLIGSFGGEQYLNDVSEMLLMLSAVLFFVIAILKKEAAAKDQYDQQA